MLSDYLVSDLLELSGAMDLAHLRNRILVQKHFSEYSGKRLAKTPLKQDEQ